MKRIALCLLSLFVLRPLAAEPTPLSPGVVVPSPTAAPSPLSTPAVTPDPRFSVADYAWKWPHISLEEAQRMHARKDVLFVDGRAMVEWEQSHIPGSVPLPIGEFDKNYDSYKKKIKAAKILVSYCHGEGCRLSDMLAQKLVDKGHHNVAVFWGGFPAWDSAKMPLVDKKGKLIERPTPVPAGPVTPTTSTLP